MFRQLLIGTAIATVMAFGITTGTSAQETQDTAGQHMKKAGKATREAAKETGKATEKVAKKTGQVTEDAAKETATGTKKAAKKVGKAVTPDTTSATCNDGTVQTGKTKTTACANHGGVKG
jgi:hypothetical protein